MAAPVNEFKKALQENKLQVGLWQALASPYTVEICAGSGYDWLLLDGEHAPNDVPMIADQIRAMQGGTAHAVVRPPIGETWLIKQYLDIGAQSLLIPMVESAAQAEELVRAVRYAPRGVRGVGAQLARAAQYNRTKDYFHTADAQICLLVQVETVKGIAALDAIAATDGVDGVFIGPADLAADMGHIDNPGHPEVQAVIEAAIARILAHGKAPGILIGNLALSKRYAQLGATFVAIGHDVGLLVNASEKLLADFHAAEPAAPVGKVDVY
ncbi:2,4-dihydroxyhept-2-ene-1,7-dioic acid aldolase [Ketogulonicigenium vulgare Y25]|uniref:Hydroxypyruvate/pyruvate aldolase n=1 Tax=Ketogulonicigenium vulgare (strain WSH-001) TaxID=759362 RepID=F9Y513_KETVW|nr:4-hydroxy-2-oxoheptanedioate aldolase [Ketogulonicigenium vulgare]ADO42446.1 2,4-dihydroxyhept-2-ene-1,7-dioic acid aldolase [Ketogulonicigenium vulgare Y25]AEM40645.1 HpcH/HpaI aldolase /citrate lyase family protein [Ketogulonicigenium vulgare WSH-001]ALJ80818.1 2-keto-3-deoxy-L-rhamnonate aldolase [Ketogulonicigenium vulgare]AOZ54359.1 2,4-dihydroxyhept-2-ene-1,7-dioic acid aldolase [Ketogulonicigenium vulgare]